MFLVSRYVFEKIWKNLASAFLLWLTFSCIKNFVLSFSETPRRCHVKFRLTARYPNFLPSRIIFVFFFIMQFEDVDKQQKKREKTISRYYSSSLTSLIKFLSLQWDNWVSIEFFTFPFLLDILIAKGHLKEKLE